MRRIATAVSAVAVVLLTASLFAQAKPNFTGKWAPDAEKNAAAGGGGGRGGGRGGGGPMTITMDATMLKIERAAQDGSMTATTYKLDGSESKNMMAGRGGGAPTEQVSMAKIDGMKVVITTKTPNGDQVSSWYMEGDELVSERAGQNGAMKTYYKKGM